jgi:hypothetical protein
MWAALVAAILLAPAPDPSPPASRIVFASARTGVAQLYSMQPSGAGLAQLTFGGLSNGEDVTLPGVTVAELTDAGLFFAYVGDKPWPGRIRFIPFDELPL